jgi:hypothetical protein
MFTGVADSALSGDVFVRLASVLGLGGSASPGEGAVIAARMGAANERLGAKVARRARADRARAATREVSAFAGPAMFSVTATIAP